MGKKQTTNKLADAVENGLTEIFDTLKLTEIVRQRLRGLFLKGFQVKLSGYTAHRSENDSEPILQSHTSHLKAGEGKYFKAELRGDLLFSELSFSNLIRILFKKTLKNIKITVASHEINLKEADLN